jgi:hypothetical protein
MKYNDLMSDGGLVKMPQVAPIKKSIITNIAASSGDIFIPTTKAAKASVPLPDLNKKIAELKLEGHTNEVNQLYELKTKLDTTFAGLGELDVLTNSLKYRTVLSQYEALSNGDVLNQIKNNKKRTEEGYTRAVSNKIEDEWVVKDNKVWVDDGSKIYKTDLITGAKLKSEGKAKWLTGRDLYRERDVNDKLIDNNEASTDIGYGYNRSEVYTQLDLAFTNLGSTKRGGTSGKEVFRNYDLGEYGNQLYQYSQKTTTDIDNNSKQLLEATSLLLGTLDQGMKDWLNATAANNLVQRGEEVTNESLRKSLIGVIASVSSKSYKDTNIGGTVGAIGAAVKPSDGSPASGGGSTKTEKVGSFESVTSFGVYDPTTGQAITILNEDGSKKNVFGMPYSMLRYIKPTVVNENGLFGKKPSKTVKIMPTIADAFKEGLVLDNAVIGSKNLPISATRIVADPTKNNGQFYVIDEFVDDKGKIVDKNKVVDNLVLQITKVNNPTDSFLSPASKKAIKEQAERQFEANYRVRRALTGFVLTDDVELVKQLPKSEYELIDDDEEPGLTYSTLAAISENKGGEFDSDGYLNDYQLARVRVSIPIGDFSSRRLHDNNNVLINANNAELPTLLQAQIQQSK